MADDGGPEPQRVPSPTRFRGGGCRPAVSSSMRGGRRTRSPAGHPAPSLSGRSRLASPVRPPRRRAEQSKPTPAGAHSLAARPSTLAGSLSSRCVLRCVPYPGFEPGPPGSEPGASASWARRARRERRGSNPPCSLGKAACHRQRFAHVVSSAGLEPALASISGWCLCRWATRTRSLRPGSNRLPASYEDAALPRELRRHKLGYQASNLESS